MCSLIHNSVFGFFTSYTVKFNFALLLRPLDDKTAMLFRPLDDKTAMLFRLLDDKTAMLLRPLDDKTAMLFRPPIFSILNSPLLLRLPHY